MQNRKFNENYLFDLINDNGYDMEDLIESLSDKELLDRINEYEKYEQEKNMERE